MNLVSPRPQFDEKGWLDSARCLPSPHCDARPEGETVSVVVVHSISLPPGEFGGDGVERFFTGRLDPDAHPYYRQLEGLRVSAHFFVRRHGNVIQFVPCGLRAWHAGVSVWRGRERCNDFSVGIELEGCDSLCFTKPQYERLAELVLALRSRYPIADVVGHDDIAPGRKTDPGPHFDWALLRQMTDKG